MFLTIRTVLTLLLCRAPAIAAHCMMKKANAR